MPTLRERKRKVETNAGDSSSDDGKEPEREVQAVLNKRLYRKNVQYQVKWVGAGETTWESKASLEKLGKEFIEEFEKNAPKTETDGEAKVEAAKPVANKRVKANLSSSAPAPRAAGKPKYIERSGDPLAATPATGTEAMQYVWVVETQGTDQLQTLLDQQINSVLQQTGKLRRYYVLSKYILNVWQYTPSVGSDPAPWSQWGVTHETITTFFVPVVAVDGILPVGLVMWIPNYIIVDTIMSLLIGRESYGFPKNQGVFTDYPMDPSQIQSLSVSTELWVKYGPTIPKTLQTLWTVNKIPNAPEEHALKFVLVEQTLKSIDNVILRGLASAVNLTNLFDGISIGGLFEPKGGISVPSILLLKQFRDAADQSVACYQAVVEAPMTANKIYGVGLINLLPKYQFTVTLADSMPVGADLGLKIPLNQPTGTQSLGAGFWAKLDWTSELGKIIAEL